MEALSSISSTSSSIVDQALPFPSPYPGKKNMADDAAALKAAAEAAEAAVTQQDDTVRALKAEAKSGTATKVR